MANKDFYKFDKPLQSVPIFGDMDPEQTKAIAGSNDEVYYVDIKKKEEYDFSKQEKVKSISCVAFNNNNFYVVCNSKNEKLGLYLFIIDTLQPEKECEYLLHWQNKLNIGNCDCYFMMEEVDG
jgi:hypothetical protein